MTSSQNSPSRESTSSARASIMADETLPRDFSLASLTSSESQTSDEFFKCKDHSIFLLQQMQKYLEDHQLCDVILIAGVDGKR